MEIIISVTEHFIISLSVHYHKRDVDDVIGCCIKMHRHFIVVASEHDSNCLRSVAIK
jgi:hypothetical protein